MSRNTKILLGVLAGLLGLCACSVFGIVALGGILFSRVATVAPDRVESVAVQVGVPELPEYAPEWALDLLGIKAVGYRAGSQHVMMATIPANIEMNMEEIQRQMERAVRDRDGYRWNSNEMKVVGQETRVIAGQQVEVMIAEGAGSNGPFRQLSGLYENPTGRTFFIISGPIASWNDVEVDGILKSLK